MVNILFKTDELYQDGDGDPGILTTEEGNKTKHFFYTKEKLNR